MIFASVGTSDLPFDRLVRDVGELPVSEGVVVQRGPSRVRPERGTCVDFMPFEDVVRHMRAARAVVTHAGVGSVMSALAAGKRPIVVPRLRNLREARDDHQLELGRRLVALGLVTLAQSRAELERAVAESRAGVSYAPGDGELARELGRFLEECCTTADRARTVLTLPPPLPQNPYQRLLYEHLAARGFSICSGAKLRAGWLFRRRRDVGVMHFHWPQAYYRFERGPASVRAVLSWTRLGLFALRLQTARAFGYRIVWTVHQVLPHEARPGLGDGVAARLLGRASSALICHDAHTRESIACLLGATSLRRTTIVPHGSYVGVYPAGRPPGEVRAELGIDASTFTFLCFGELKAYKALDVLLGAIERLRDRAVFVVAGAPRDAGAERSLRAAAAADGRIRLRLGFVPDERVAELFAACDAAVLPRGDGGSSGALVLALSQGVPVVCADRESYRRLTGDGAAAWYFEPGDPDSLAQALHGAAQASAGELRARARAARDAAAALDWDGVAERTAAVLLGRNGA